MAHAVEPARTEPKPSNTGGSSRGRGRSTAVWIAVVAIVVVIALVAIGYVVWDRNFRTASPVNPGLACPTVVRPTAHPPLAMRGVKRVTLIGDSIMDQASCSVASSLAGLGVETFRHGVPGSGFLNTPPEWVQMTKQLVAAEHPDVVVAIFVGNYIPPVPPGSPSRIEVDSPRFFTSWQQKAQAISDVVRGSGAKMYWVSPPPIVLGTLSHAQRLFEGYKSIKGDHTLGSGSSLAGPDGKEVTNTFTCGQRKTIRTFDGTHLTPDGARIYGQSIAHDLSADLGVLTSPKPC